MFKKLIFVFFFAWVISSTGQAQVGLVSFKGIEDRIAKSGDTTYVLNFWATWCGPCVEELPAFEKINATQTSQPIKVILLSLDFKSKLNTTVIPFVKKHQIKSEVFIVDEKDQQKFIDNVDKSWSGALPATLIVKPSVQRRSFYEKSFTYEELSKAVFDVK